MIDFSNLRVLFLVSAFNGLSQKIWVNLTPRFKSFKLQIGVDEHKIHAFHPDLILSPFLQHYIPDSVWFKYPCLIVHPGPPGDGGPSSLNWAILNKQKKWGVSILQGDAGWDCGKVWASDSFDIPEDATVGGLYRNQISDTTLRLVPEAISNYLSQSSPIETPALEYRKKITQDDLSFSWSEPAVDILRKIRAGDSQPGTIGEIEGKRFHLFGAFLTEEIESPGKIKSLDLSGITIGTGDRCIHIRQLAIEGDIKQRACEALKTEAI